MKDIEGEKQKYEGHGNNWAAVIDNFDEARTIEIAKTVMEDEKASFATSRDFLGMISFEPPFRVLALIHGEKEGSQLYSLYPFFQVSNPLDVEISEIHEWENTAEAVIEGSIGGASVSFFDTLYFLNKDKYKMNHVYRFNIAGLAHSFIKRTKDLQFVTHTGPMKGEKIDTTRMTAYAPIHEYGGEFTFYHPFESFSGSIEVLGLKFFQYPFYLRGLEDNIAFRFPLFVREQTLKGYKPELKDPVAGTGWLQGYLVDSEIEL